MCVIACVVGVFREPASAKGHPKAKSKIKPIERTKIFKGRVAPPLGDASLWVYPASKFFSNFFDANSFIKFFF